WRHVCDARQALDSSGMNGRKRRSSGSLGWQMSNARHIAGLYRRAFGTFAGLTRSPGVVKLATVFVAALLYATASLDPCYLRRLYPQRLAQLAFRQAPAAFPARQRFLRTHLRAAAGAAGRAFRSVAVRCPGAW